MIHTSVKIIRQSQEYQQLKDEIIENNSPALSHSRSIIRQIDAIEGEGIEVDFFKHPLLRGLYRELETNNSPASFGAHSTLKSFLQYYECDLSEPFFSKWNLNEDELNSITALTSDSIRFIISKKFQVTEQDSYPFSRAELLELLEKEFPDSVDAERITAINNFLKDSKVKKTGYGRYVYRNNDVDEMSAEFILNSISELIEKFKSAEITVPHEIDIKEIKNLMFLSVTAENKLKSVLKELKMLLDEMES